MIAGLYPLFSHWHTEGTVHIISDPHFGDAELRAGQPNRPSDEDIIKNINSKVGRKDHLIILGDIGDIEMAKQLRGHKILVCGNHDIGHTKYAEIFEEIYPGPVMIGEKLILSHEPIPSITWACNLHGHDHSGRYNPDPYHYNFCAEAIGFRPVNLNQWMKEGHLAPVQSLHREIIDNATKKARKRGHKLGGKK